jgi:hypothetical protein
MSGSPGPASAPLQVFWTGTDGNLWTEQFTPGGRLEPAGPDRRTLTQLLMTLDVARHWMVGTIASGRARWA